MEVSFVDGVWQGCGRAVAVAGAGLAEAASWVFAAPRAGSAKTGLPKRFADATNNPIERYTLPLPTAAQRAKTRLVSGKI